MRGEIGVEGVVVRSQCRGLCDGGGGWFSWLWSVVYALDDIVCSGDDALGSSVGIGARDAMSSLGSLVVNSAGWSVGSILEAGC